MAMPTKEYAGWFVPCANRIGPVVGREYPKGRGLQVKPRGAAHVMACVDEHVVDLELDEIVGISEAHFFSKDALEIVSVDFCAFDDVRGMGALDERAKNGSGNCQMLDHFGRHDFDAAVVHTLNEIAPEDENEGIVADLL